MDKLRYIFFAILAFIYYMCFQGPFSHVIYYHGQHHLFLYSHDYFLRHAAVGNLSGYVADFIIQFFYIHELGCLIVALILASAYLLSDKVIRLLSRRGDVMQLALIPSALLFFYLQKADHQVASVVECMGGLCIACLALSVMRKKWHLPPQPGTRSPMKKSVRMGMAGALFAIYVCAGYHFLLRRYDFKERIMIKTEQAARRKDWDEVLEHTGRYLAAGKSNQYIAFFRNLALYHAGKLPYQLFDYPQALGVKALYFPWSSDSRESEYGHYLYEELGYLNEAHRWEFESMVVWGETAPHLINLARYNIAMGRPRVAQQFINRLKQSLFYGKEAAELEKMCGRGEVPGLANALKHVEDVPARFANVYNIGPELKYLCRKNPGNRMAFEYLMAQLLLSNHVPRFVENLAMMRNFDYPAMPPCYEEALYLYKLKVGEEAFSRTGFAVGTETESRFKRYYQLVQSGRTQLLQKEFGHTYWFYLNFVSPYGNKIITD